MMHGAFYGFEGISFLWWLGPLFMFLFWGLVITGIVMFIKRMGSYPRRVGAGYEDSALELLRKRYVKGEIDKGEFYEKAESLDSVKALLDDENKRRSS